MGKLKRDSIFSILMCYLLGVTIYSFDPLMQSFPSIMTNEFMKAFSASALGVGFIASSYFYSYNLMQIPAGMFCDQLGIRFILIISSLICMTALILFSYVHTVQTAMICRILMGLGASCAAVVLVLVCKEYFAIRFLPLLIGIAQFVCNIGALCGQYPLAYLSTAVGWRTSIFLLSIIPLSILILTCIFFKKRSPTTITIAKTYQDYISEIKTVFLNRYNWQIALYAMLLWTPFYIFSSLWGIPFFREALGINVADASKLIAMAWIGSGIGSILIGIWSSYFQKRKLCILVSSLIGIAVFPFLIFITNVTLLYMVLFVFGIASAGQALSFTLISDHNKNEVLGTASGFNNTIIMVGPMLISPVLGGLLKFFWDGTIKDGTPFYSVTAFQKSFILIPILFAASWLVGFFYKEKSKTNAFEYQASLKALIISE